MEVGQTTLKGTIGITLQGQDSGIFLTFKSINYFDVVIFKKKLKINSIAICPFNNLKKKFMKKSLKRRKSPILRLNLISFLQYSTLRGYFHPNFFYFSNIRLIKRTFSN